MYNIILYPTYYYGGERHFIVWTKYKVCLSTDYDKIFMSATELRFINVKIFIFVYLLRFKFDVHFINR